MPSSPSRSSRYSEDRPRQSHRSRSPSRRSRYQDESPHHRRRRSRSPSHEDRRGRHNGKPRDDRRSGQQRQRRGDDRREQYSWGGRSPSPEKDEDQPEPEAPNYGLSGKLAAETNTVNGVELKYNEPHEAAKPKQHWRFYVFKGSEQIDLLHVHRQSAFLIGRDRPVVDIPVDHPSCSKQHAVLQYRRTTDENGQPAIKPYLIDLESTNGTSINGEKIPASRYVELKMKDVVTFGQSTREYVLLHSD